MIFSVIRFMWLVTAQIVLSLTVIQGVSAQTEPTKDLLAAQIRDQGYRCNQPLSASRDLKRSKADEAVWVLRCNNATYRLRLTPDMAARVRRLK